MSCPLRGRHKAGPLQMVTNATRSSVSMENVLAREYVLINRNNNSSQMVRRKRAIGHLCFSLEVTNPGRVTILDFRAISAVSGPPTVTTPTQGYSIILTSVGESCLLVLSPVISYWTDTHLYRSPEIPIILYWRVFHKGLLHSIDSQELV